MPPSVHSYQRLFPEPAEISAPDALATLRAHERAPADRPLVLVDMVTSLDGRATVEGRSKFLGSDADTEILVELRTLADAVLVGPATVRAESYGDLAGTEERRARRRAAGRAERPPAVLITRSGSIPWEAGLFAAPAQPVLIYSGVALEPPASVVAPVTVHRLDEPTPAAALAHLRAEHSVRVVLCEGGPKLLHSLLADGLVDELFLTVVPALVGDDAQPRIVSGGPFAGGPVGFELRWILRCGGELFLRYG
jgi:riboflavin biosynthesis pyrimidine reductase